MKVFLILISGFMILSFSACSQKNMVENSTSGKNQIAEGKETPESETDLYTGAYADYDTNETNLEIQRNDDGTYKIQIGIYRLAYLDDGIGEVTADGLSFSATAPNGSTIEGMITLEQDIATVKFISAEWKEYSSVNEYQYHRI